MSSAAPVPEKYTPCSLSATLKKSQPLTAEVRLLTLEIEGDSQLEYRAGQSIRVEQESNGKLVPLAYSIASPPGSGNRIELCIKSGRKGSPADRLCALPVGTLLRFSLPESGFTLQPAETASLFLAAGTGIAPIRSMVHSLLREDAGQTVTLIFGAKNAGSLFFHTEFLDLAERYANFRYIPVLSRPQQGWDGARGYVQNHLDGIAPQASRAYLCGPPAMIENASRSLAERGWPEHRIHFERY
jgi:ferredoxin-NADP reductase